MTPTPSSREMLHVVQNPLSIHLEDHLRRQHLAFLLVLVRLLATYHVTLSGMRRGTSLAMVLMKVEGEDSLDEVKLPPCETHHH
jgi:hypothetical protein